jgi:hypothetical protein
MNEQNDIREGDIRATAALISGYTGEAIVTDAEVAAILEWCRDWASDCEWGDADSGKEARDVVTYWRIMPATDLLRASHKYIDGGLRFVLADVRRLANDRVSFESADPASAARRAERTRLYGATAQDAIVDDAKPAPIAEGDRVIVTDSYEGGRTISYEGTVVRVLRSGTVLIDDAKATDGAGTPIRHYANGTIAKVDVPRMLLEPPNAGREHDEMREAIAADDAAFVVVDVESDDAPKVIGRYVRTDESAIVYVAQVTTKRPLRRSTAFE